MAKTQTRRASQQQQQQTTNKQQESHPKNMKKSLNRGAWTAEEDTNLAHVIQIYGPRRWKAIAAKAGINRCGKSCRLRWMNYLRPNIKRGNISDQEEDLILRLHKLLGNRWSLIAGRLPGRTDNEIKNYWNSHLSKKLNNLAKEKTRRRDTAQEPDQSEEKMSNENRNELNLEMNNRDRDGKEEMSKDAEFNVDDFFDFSNENPQNLEWVNRFLELDERS
ncbi:uncharacterized protein [Phyllobates terribilis]|uniref:uncharacterized protein n=1 Tax=Phyllobates terribilis TaxID=111132 RepID=UPI003CCAE0AB